MTDAPTSRLAIGVDYGTNSVRALVVDIASGVEVATHVFDYPSGENGVLLDPADPNLARQHPADYIDGFHASVGMAVQRAVEAGHRASDVVGIGVDTTGSTPIPVDPEGTPLALQDRFTDELAACAWLWKDHTAWAEAAEITEAADGHPDAYLTRCGGTYSSEWYWAKILRCARAAPEVFEAAYSWVELADYVPGYITGRTDPDTMARGICAAGHKAMYHPDWGGLPDREFLASLHPGLAELRDRYTDEALTADRKAGELSAEVAAKVGLPAGVPVAVGAFDAHMGAVGAGVAPGVLVKIIGTSTCDIMVAPLDRDLPDVPGLCGIVPGSVTPDTYGLEAGQSAVGDIFHWFADRVVGSSEEGGHGPLTDAAAELRAGESGLMALDWNNGNRTILVDPGLTGLLVGQTLSTTPGEIYRALIEATAFGALRIIDRLEEYGVAVEEVVCCGGIADKNPLVMRIYADVCDRPMKLSRSAQTCALGAAIFGAVAGGGHPDVATAQQKMTGFKETVYEPDPESAAVYAELYTLYRRLHDAFGGVDESTDLGGVMKELIAIRDRTRKG